MSGPKLVDDGSVSLTVPGRPEYLRLVRLAAADAGARADLSIEEVEDLRIAVDELTYALMGDEPTSDVVTLRFRASESAVEIEGTCVSHGEVVVSDLSRSIVGAVVDEYDVHDREGVRSFRLVKRKRP